MNEEEIIKNTKIAIDLYIDNNGCIIDRNILQGLLDLYQKEKEKNKELLDKNKIIKILGFDENTSNDTIYRNIEILVSEFERLEDIEDRKVQVEYDFVFNQGVRSVEKKLKEKIEKLNQEIASPFGARPDFQVKGEINLLQELLEERNLIWIREK